MMIFRLLPEHIRASILALLRRWDYPSLAFVCRKFRRAVASEELYEDRIEIRNTESVLYALIRFSPSLPACYVLNKKKNGSFRLTLIENLAYRPYGAAVVTSGFHMYVFGGEVGSYKTSGVFRIDSRTHKIESLPSMLKARLGAVAAVVNRKIYVIGGCEMESDNDWAEEFDIETQSWRDLPLPYSSVIRRLDTLSCVVMEDKIYVRDQLCCFTYEPKDDKWETVGVFNWWRPCSCVVDDVLYSFDPLLCSASPLVAFDPKDECWRPVRFFEGLFPMPNLLYYEAKMANVGGKLVILAGNKSYTESYSDGLKGIWCIEITLERGEDGEFRGRIVRAECMLISSSACAPWIEHCLGFTL